MLHVQHAKNVNKVCASPIIFLFFHPLFTQARILRCRRRRHLHHCRHFSFEIEFICCASVYIKYIYIQVSASVCVRAPLYFIYVLILIISVNLPAVIWILLSSSLSRKACFFTGKCGFKINRTFQIS